MPRKRRSTASTSSLERTITRIVLSPAIVPNTSGQRRLSTASPATCALPGSVWMTIRLLALLMSTTESESMRMSRSFMPCSLLSMVA